MGNNEGQTIEYPDAYVVVFDSANNATGHICNDGRNIIRYILNGNEVESTGTNTVAPVREGLNVVYYWLKAKDRLWGNHVWEYFRIPADCPFWSPSMMYYQKITQIDCLAATPPQTDSYFITNRGIDILRVPVGSAALYRADAGWNTATSIIETDNFNYPL